MDKKIFRNKLFLASIWFVIIFSIMIVPICNFTIVSSTKEFNSYNLNDVPYNRVGILLGTSKFTKNGNNNLYYSSRISAAVELFQNNKIKYILISGSNISKYYDETLLMKNDLLYQGIPEEFILIDDCGFRTYDSILNINNIYDQKSFTIISQKFHNERAIFIAKSQGLESFGYNAATIANQQLLNREYLARVKVFIDLIIEPNTIQTTDKIFIN